MKTLRELSDDLHAAARAFVTGAAEIPMSDVTPVWLALEWPGRLRDPTGANLVCAGRSRREGRPSCSTHAHWVAVQGRTRSGADIWLEGRCSPGRWTWGSNHS